MVILRQISFNITEERNMVNTYLAKGRRRRFSRGEYNMNQSQNNCNDHSHHHDHSHAHGFDSTMGKRFLLAIVLNLGYVASEFYLGFCYDSAGLLADAGHNLSDTGGLLISLIAFFMLKKHPTVTFTYGYKKATVLATFVNGLLLMGAVGMIFYESLEKLIYGSVTSGIAIMITAGVGILVNGITVFLFSKGKEQDLNVKSAYLHMLSDTLVSCGVVLSGGIILASHWTWVDPIIGMLIAGVILWAAWGVFKESVILILDGVPQAIDLEELKQELLQIKNVEDIHHIHVWSVSTVENALTAHVKLQDAALLETTKKELKYFLNQHHIAHSSLEFELTEYCSQRSC